MSRLQSAAGHVRRDWSFGQWPLRRKLAAAVVLPMVLAFVFGGLRVQSDFASAQQLTAAADTVNVIRPVIDYNLAVQRLAAADSVGGSTLTLATARYKSAAADLSAAMKRSNVPDSVRAKATSALSLGEAVRSAKAQTGFSDVVIEKSGNIATVMSEVVSDLGLTDDPASAKLVLALQDTITGQRALTGQQINLANTDDAAAELRAIGEVGAETSALTRLQTELPTFSSPIRQVLNDNTRRAGVLEGTPTKDDIAGLAPVFQSSNATYTTLLDGQLSSLASTLVDRANANRSGAVFAALLVTAALLAAVLIVIASIRLLLSTIRVVREGALDVAENRLPAAVAKIRDGEEAPPFEPIPVTTTEEMGQLARAVDDLHTQALTLAGEQARLRVQVGHMFETLSRRSTSLIDQQLTLIERLESDEEDPKRLQSLFRLDHLAARMRRNSDSLLVLAGTSTRRAVTGSVSVADAVRAAVSEVENYERIDIGDTANDHVLGAVGSDLIHLLAEIVDNALAYSPPTTRVAIRGARTPDGGLLVEVADRGLGMPPKDLAALNDQLAHGGDITADTARRMGLYVVGSLAKRHGIAVRLRRNGDEVQGVTVSIHLPSGLLADSATIRPDRGRSARAASTPSPALDGDGKPTVTPSVVGGSTKSGLPTRVRGASGATPIPDAAKKVVPPRIPSADSLPSANASVAPVKPVIETSPAGDVASSGDAPMAPNGKAADAVNGNVHQPLNGKAAEPLTGQSASGHTNGVAAPEAKDISPESKDAPSEVKDGSSETDGAVATPGDPTVAPRSASGLPVRKPRASRITEYREFGNAPAEQDEADSIAADGSVSDSLAEDAGAPQTATNVKANRLASWLPGRAKAAAEAARLEAEANEPRQMPSNLSAWLDHRAKLVEAAKQRELGTQDSDVIAGADSDALASDAQALDLVGDSTAGSSDEMHVPDEWVAEVVGDGDPSGEAVVEALPAEPPVLADDDAKTSALDTDAGSDTRPEASAEVAPEGTVPVSEEASLPTRIPGTSGAPTSNEQAAPTGRVFRRAHTTSFFGARKARETADQPLAEQAEQPLAEPEVAVALEAEPEVAPAMQAEPEVQPAMEPEPEPAVAREAEPEVAPALEAEPEVAPALEAEVAPAMEPEPEEAPTAVLNDTPIFRAMMSRWLTDDPGPAAQAPAWSPTEADEVFSAAASNEEAAPLEQSSAGLPMRRPGNHMVVGGMERTGASPSAPPAPNRRDPEAIRRSLNRHQQGVSSARTETQDGTQREDADVHQ